LSLTLVVVAKGVISAEMFFIRMFQAAFTWGENWE